MTNLKVQVQRDSLVAALGVVARAASGSAATLEIAQTCLVSSDNGRLRLACTDLSVAMEVWCGGQVLEEGAFALNAALFLKAVRNLPQGSVVTLSGEGGGKVDIVSGRTRQAMHSYQAEDFPRINRVGEAKGITLPTAAFRTAIERTAIAIDLDDTRPVLTGIQFAFAEDTLTLAAADGFRLSVASFPVTGAGEATAIVPGRVARELARLLDHDSVRMRMDDSRVTFELEDVVLSAQLIQGAFPNYRQLIPEGLKTTVTVGAKDMQSAVRVLQPWAMNHVKLKLTPDGLSLTAAANQIGDGQTLLDARVEGEADAKIAIAPRYLSDVFGLLDGDVAIGINSPSSQMTVVPVEQDSVRFTHVVMPLFVQW